MNGDFNGVGFLFSDILEVVLLGHPCEYFDKRKFRS